MTPETAGEIGQDAVIWLAGEPEALAAFVGASGIDARGIAHRGADLDFLAAVLDWLCSSDATILAFAAATGHRPEDPARARAFLSGPTPDWT
jgi:hypothetical protein